MSPLSSILLLILLISGMFLISMVFVFALFWSRSATSSCGHPLLVSIVEDDPYTKFVCSGVIVSRDHMIALSECFSDQKVDEISKESFQISSGSEFWYSSTNLHRITNLTKVDDSIFCMKVTPPFPSCAYDGSKILIADPKLVNGTYSAKGWSRNWEPRIITRNLNSIHECMDAPGALIVDQDNILVGFQGMNCVRVEGSRMTNVYYFKDFFGRNGVCTNETLLHP